MSRLAYLVPVRFLCAVAITAVFSGVMRLFPDDGGGANIGAGLLLFAMLWAMAFAWSLFDARRHGFALAIVAWALIGLLIGIAFPISIAITDGGWNGDWDGAVLLSDLSFFIPFWLSSIVVLAAIGAAVGNSLRRQPIS